MTSHETACLLNASDQDAHVQITIYFSDKDPVGPYWTPGRTPTLCSQRSHTQQQIEGMANMLTPTCPCPLDAPWQGLTSCRPGPIVRA